ncbi:hypothetical protein SPG90_21665 (plasmid) [Enterobacter sp. D2]|uniref:hypothetical protein n=1 Tax=Enterobacter sp. D2 TaxID=3102784 RepID=UPI002ACACB1F|nr:hypothetical protein [Enterobacter sp. D2]MDZ5731100.1 hypothetical protein [Enterobacter sp. D2]
MRKETGSIVIDALYLNGRYALAVREGDIKLLIEALVTHPVRKGDLLLPMDKKTYTVNNEKGKTVSVLSATQFSVSQWRILKMLACRESAVGDPESTASLGEAAYQ